MVLNRCSGNKETKQLQVYNRMHHVYDNDKFSQHMAKRQNFKNMFTSNINEKDIPCPISQPHQCLCPYVSMSCLSRGPEMYLPTTHAGTCSSSRCLPRSPSPQSLFPASFLNCHHRHSLSLPFSSSTVSTYYSDTILHTF